MRRWAPYAAGAVVLALTLVAALPVNADGADFEWQVLPGLDELIRGNWDGFVDDFPLMGPLSVAVRAPLVALVFDADIRVVYLVSSIPCLAVYGVAIAMLARRLAARNGPGSVWVIALVVAVANIAVFRALHWGHPEDLMAAGLLLIAAMAALQGRHLVVAGALGLALATKQWTLLAFLPLAWMVTEHKLRVLLTALGVGAVLTAPLAIAAPERFEGLVGGVGNPERFWRLERPPGQDRLPGDTPLLPDRTHVTPANIWWPVAARHDEVRDGRRARTATVPDSVVTAAHLLVGVLAVALWGASRRRPRDLLGVVALTFLLRCMLDPIDFDYYHVTSVMFLAAWEAWSGRTPWLTLGAAAGLAVTYIQPATRFVELYDDALFINLTYLAWTTLLVVLIVARLRRSAHELAPAQKPTPV